MVLVAVVPAAILSFQASHQGRQEATVTTEDFIIAVFCEIDDQLGPLPKHPQAKLWPSEVSLPLASCPQGLLLSRLCAVVTA